MINGQQAYRLIDTGAEANVITKDAAIKLGIKHTLSNAQLKTGNAPMTPVDGIAYEVKLGLGNWRGKAHFYVAPFDIFDIVLGQPFLRHNHVLITPYLEELMVFDQQGPFVLPLISVPKSRGQALLSAMQFVEESQGKSSFEGMDPGTPRRHKRQCQDTRPVQR